METEKSKNAPETAQINFKLSALERELIEKSSEQAGVTLSEYCRIKCLLDEDQAFMLKTKACELEKVVKELRIKLSFYKDTGRDPNNIVLQMTSRQRAIFEALYSGFDICDNDDSNVGRDIIACLLHLTKYTFQDLFSDKGVTQTEIEDTFYPII